MSVTTRGDPANLTWALFDYPDGVHAVQGKYRADAVPDWPTDHVASFDCPCRPDVFDDSEAAPKLLYEHHEWARV